MLIPKFGQGKQGNDQVIFRAHTPIILIVDDEPVNVEILATLLGQEYHVKVAGNGKTALAIAAQHPQPDLILLDVMMPDMDGFEVCRQLKDHVATRDISVIFITAAAGELSESQGLQLGAVDYIIKPINRVTTLLRVKNHLVLIQLQRRLVERGGFLDTLIENAPHAVWVLARNDRWLLLNKTALALLECDDLQQANSLPAFAFVDAPYRQAYIASHQLALAGGSTVLELEITGVKATRRWLEISVSSLSDAYHQIIATLSVANDITQRKQGEAGLRLSAKLLENAQEGILITDLNGKIQNLNPAFSRITGYERDDVLGRNPKLLKSGLQSDEFYQLLWKSIQNDGFWQGEIWNRKKNGELVPEWLSITRIHDDHGRPECYLGVYTDITKIKQHEEQLKQIAHYDALTGIPNRILLDDRMKQGIARCKREQKLLAVCYLDLDGFKAVNDEIGHAAGDLVLIECARRITQVIREMDTVARLGGDEFVVLLQDIGHAGECSATLDRLLAAISVPVVIGNRMFGVGASIGIALYPPDGEEPDLLLRHADQAMYIAKQSGKNRYHFFDAEQDDRLRRFNGALQRIYQAFDDEELELFYQPKVDLQTHRVIGAEALIRWRHPERGLLSPLEFLPFIEQTDLEIRLGDWVIDKALTQLREWQQQGLVLELSINITANHLQADNFVVNLQKKLAAYPELANGALQIEILETVALEDFDKVRGIITASQAFGVSFALDDFGTGYSSLTFLRNLPVDTIKIDQSFIRDMLVDQSDYAIIQGIIALANVFDRQIVAEGVETMAHFQALAGMDCHIAQGFGIARPMPAGDFVLWCINYAADQRTHPI
ncbi:MAG: EAL domain-containing protein [Methylovulum sp.]|nr:EAL domain-containing protein [Methylovulum sp.]